MNDLTLKGSQNDTWKKTIHTLATFLQLHYVKDKSLNISEKKQVIYKEMRIRLVLISSPTKLVTRR